MNSKRTGREEELNRLVRDTALTHDNVLSLEDLLILGLSRRMIERRVRSGLLIPILKGSYALPGARLRLRGRCRAAAASVSECVVVSHGSALALHGLVRDPTVVHLVGEPGVFRDSPRGRWQSENFGFKVIRHETRFLPPEHLEVVAGIRATTVERSIRDFSSTAKPSEITKALTQGERERSFCWDKLNSLVASSNGHRGMTILQTEINEWTEALVNTSSEGEIDFFRMIRNRRLPIPEVNVRLGDYVADFLWRHLNMAVEFDPYGTHSGLASHRQDHRKGIELEVSGLRVIRFTGEDLYQHEPRTADELETVMRQQAELLGCPLFPAVQPGLDQPH
jgi:very-short-patch-repair endonuclease